MSECNVGDLPEEVLEYILSLISPYRDVHNCLQVSKRWQRCVQNVIKTKKRNLHRAIIDFDVKWDTLTPQKLPPSITKRYSHSAVVYDNSMYIFGGCTCSMTTFNDLWRFDLSTREWIRPITLGTYPSPKACSSFVCYKDYLILFGGWTYPPSYPLYQSWHLFNELHYYDTTINRWVNVNSVSTPPPMAGHSASVIGEWMIVFGGLHKPESAVHCEKSNDVWRLNLETWDWHKQPVAEGPKPSGRVGQTQVVLDDTHILIMGGSGGPTNSYSDVWVLNMEAEIWRWKQIEVRGETYKPSNIWSNPGCKIGDKIVVLNRVREIEAPPIVFYPKTTWITGRINPVQESRNARIDLANRDVDRDENVNGKRGTLRHNKREAEDLLLLDNNHRPGTSGSASTDSEASDNRGVALRHKREAEDFSDDLNRLSASNQQHEIDYHMPLTSNLNLSAFMENSNQSSPPSQRTRADILREKRLSHLEKMSNVQKKGGVIKREFAKRTLGIYVLDLSHAVDVSNPYVTWLPPKNCDNGPEETVLYSLVEGNSELIMFGGIQQEAGTLKITMNLSNQISNSVHFITAPKYVI